MDATIEAVVALGLLPRGGLTPVQWKVMRTLRSNGCLSGHWLEWMDSEHKYFRARSLPALITRGLITSDLEMTPDGELLLKHLELEAKKRLWERRYR